MESNHVSYRSYLDIALAIEVVLAAILAEHPADDHELFVVALGVLGHLGLAFRCQQWVSIRNQNNITQLGVNAIFSRRFAAPPFH